MIWGRVCGNVYVDYPPTSNTVCDMWILNPLTNTLDRTNMCGNRDIWRWVFRASSVRLWWYPTTTATSCREQVAHEKGHPMRAYRNDKHKAHVRRMFGVFETKYNIIETAAEHRNVSMMMIIMIPERRVVVLGKTRVPIYICVWRACGKRLCDAAKRI